MVGLSVIIMLMITVISYIVTRTMFASAVMFSGFWLMIVLGTVFNFYELGEVADYAYLMVIVGCLSFCLSAVIFFNREHNNIRRNDMAENKIKHIWQNKLALILLGVAVVIVLVKIYIMLNVLLTLGIGAARYSSDMSIKLIGEAEILELYFAKPYLRAFLIIFSIETFKTKINVRNMLVIAFLIILSYLEDGGRSVILYEIFCLYYLYKCYGKEMSNKIVNRVRLFAICMVFLVIYATIERGSDVLSGFYTYYCGSLVYLSDVYNSNLFDGYTYGVTSFQGVLRPIFGLLNIIEIPDPLLLEEANRFIMGVQDYIVWITPNDMMNYFVTCFGYFYKDFGYIGVIIMSSIYGAICGIIDNKAKNKEDEYCIASKILMIQGIMFSMSIFCFAAFNFVMSFVYTYIIIKTSSRKLHLI